MDTDFERNQIFQLASLLTPTRKEYSATFHNKTGSSQQDAIWFNTCRSFGTRVASENAWLIMIMLSPDIYNTTQCAA